MKCPHCDKDVAIETFVPDEQRLSLAIEFESDWGAAKTIGGMITETAILLESVARQHGTKVAVLVDKAEISPRKATIGFVIVAHKAKGKRRSGDAP